MNHPHAGRRHESQKCPRYLFGRVLLFGHDAAELVVQRLSVVQVLHLVDSDQPVLRGERLLQVLELDVLVADLSVTRPVEAGWRPEVQLGNGEGCYLKLDLNSHLRSF